MRLLSATAIVAAAAVLAGCSAGGAPSSSATPKPNLSRPANEIHIYALGDAAAAVEQAAADRFNKTSEVKVIVDKGSSAGVDYAANVRSSLGTSTAPDIFMSYGAAGIKPYISANALYPLDDFIAQDPKLKSSFLPSVFNEEVVDGKSYGVPMRGVGPVVLYYNKTVLDQAGLKPPTTYNDLLGQIDKLKSAGVTPIALGGADKWPTLMWYEYFYTREVGNADVSKALAGDSSIWGSDASKKALADIRGLVDSGAFGTNYQSVHYANDGSPKLLSSGKAAYELMGNWNYGTIAGDDPGFATTNLGWTTFPTVGGSNVDDLAGNLSNYYNVAADTRYPDTVAKFLAALYGDDFVKGELAIGNLPPTTSAGSLIDSTPGLTPSAQSFLQFQLGIITKAPSFQLSWDQSVSTASAAPMLNAMTSYFSGDSDEASFISAMQALKN
ncbi:extracellular solute-binding protein [Subtercola frigoramans]